MLPVGLSDFVSHNGNNPMKLFCPRCQELYEHNVPNGNYIDGAFFGTTFPHLYLQTFAELVPPPRTTTYVPRVFGFKVHSSARQSGGGDSSEVKKALEEWPKRPKNEPMSDWDS